MDKEARKPSSRQAELLEAAYAYVLAHGFAELSLRPLAAAVGSSPRVLLYLFGSKDALVRALLARARVDELTMLEALRHDHPDADLADAAARVWEWLSAPEHHDLLRLWIEGYARSLNEPSGPWADFARLTIADWLTVLGAHQPTGVRASAAALAERTAVLALLRGALLDLLATNDRRRTTAAVFNGLAKLSRQSLEP